MIPNRHSWLYEDDGDLQVFVPGLMAGGILVSIGMLVWDAIKKLIPNTTRRARAAELHVRAVGRVNDLLSVEAGEAPRPGRVERIVRNRLAAAGLALAALAGAGTIAFMTFGAYSARTGTLAHRGWTLTGGFSVAGVATALGLVWVASAAYGHRAPAWLRRAATRWPVGALPDADAPRE